MSNQAAVYIDPPLRQLSSAYSQSGIHGLAEAILDLEKSHAPSLNVSRIKDANDYLPHAYMLLTQLDDDLLNSILSNTLPADVASGRLGLPSWAEISMQPQQATRREPGVYANYLAPENGPNLNPNEYDRFLEALAAAVKNQLMSDQTDICGLVDDNYRRRFGGSRNGFTSDIRDDGLKKQVDKFVQVNTARVQDARQLGVTEITIPGECGWSKNVHDRCKQHRELRSSPDLFRLANCVLQVLFPTRRFRMKSFCILRMFKYEHAAIGESMGSHGVASYADYGGFNFTQAGISVDAAKTMTGGEWEVVCDRLAGLLGTVEKRVDALHTELAERLAETELEIERRQKYEQLLQMSSENNTKVAKQDPELASLDAALQQCQLKAENLEERAEKKKRKFLKSVKALNDLAVAFGIDVESSSSSGMEGIE